jgi:hypothetical protein
MELRGWFPLLVLSPHLHVIRVDNAAIAIGFFRSNSRNCNRVCPMAESQSKVKHRVVTADYRPR